MSLEKFIALCAVLLEGLSFIILLPEFLGAERLQELQEQFTGGRLTTFNQLRNNWVNRRITIPLMRRVISFLMTAKGLFRSSIVLLGSGLFFLSMILSVISLMIDE